MTEDVEARVRTQVAHGMEKSMSLRDPGGWPDHDEITERINQMDNSEFLLMLSLAVEDRLEGRLLATLA